jgi:hypothetical protein
MANSKLFSGPPSNKATASTLAAAAATLFWTIAAHTFWKTMSTADLTLYITTSTVILTAVIGFLVPESAAYTQYNSQKLDAHAVAEDRIAGRPAVEPAIGALAAQSSIGALEVRIQEMQDTQNAMAARLGIAPSLAIPKPGQ